MTTEQSLKNRDLVGAPYWNLGDARSQSSLDPPPSNKEQAKHYITELNRDVQRSFTRS